MKKARLLWRFEHGYAGEVAMDAVFGDELQRLDDAFVEVSARSSAVREWDATAITLLAESRKACRAALVGRRYREALRGLDRAMRLLGKMRALLAAHDAIASARARDAQLRALVPDEGLRALPTMATPARLIETAVDYMRSARYSQAEAVADLSSAYATRLFEETPPGDAARLDLSARCLALRELDGEGPQDAGRAGDLADGMALSTLRACFDKGLVTLSLRLLGELEIAVNARAARASALVVTRTLAASADALAAQLAQLETLSGALHGEPDRRQADH